MYSLLVRTLAVIGCVVSFLFLLSPIRLLLVAPVGLGLWWLWKMKDRVSFQHTIEWIERNRVWVLTIIIMGGILVRLAVCWMFGTKTTFEGDGGVFWSYAKTLASGVWPISKSWCTILFYGGVIRIFGATVLPAFIASSILDGCTVLMGYFLVKHWSKNIVSALVFSTILAFTPNLIWFSTLIIAERIYGFFLITSLLMLTFAYESIFKQSKLQACFYSVIAGCCMWLATWSRGEGVLLWIAIPMLMIVLCFVHKIRWRLSWVMISTLCLMGVFGAFTGYTINVNTNDAQTVFCSNDNLWPRLLGAKYETSGGYNNDDTSLLWHRYLEDCSNAKSLPENYEVLTIEKFHGGQGNVSKEAVKYIKEEIALRWRNMTLQQKITLIARKFKTVWWEGRHALFAAGDPRNAPFRVITAIPSTFFVLGSFLFFLSVFYRRYDSHPLLWSILLLVIGNMGLLTLTEANHRYGWLLYQIWGIYGAVFVGSIILGRDATRLNSCGSPKA